MRVRRESLLSSCDFPFGESTFDVNNNTSGVSVIGHKSCLLHRCTCDRLKENIRYRCKLGNALNSIYPISILCFGMRDVTECTCYANVWRNAHSPPEKRVNTFVYRLQHATLLSLVSLIRRDITTNFSQMANTGFCSTISPSPTVCTHDLSLIFFYY